MTETVHYHSLLDSDLPAALALWSKAEGVELAEGDRPDELSAFLQRNPGTSQVAVRAGVLLGAVLAGQDGRRGYLYHLAVARESRGQGIGGELVRRAVSQLKAQGVCRILILVARDNEAGRLFWQRQGWDPLTFAEPMGLDV